MRRAWYLYNRYDRGTLFGDTSSDLKEICGYTLKRLLPVPAVITTECEEKQKKQERTQYNSKKEPIHNTSERCRSSYKVFSDLLRKQYTKQQNNGP